MRGEARFGRVERTGHGPVPLILFPCLGCDGRSFDQFMARNAERYTMYAVTWPGMGDTALPEVDRSRNTPFFDYIVEALVELIRDERLERPVVLGHSAAGPFVVRFAHDHPDLIGKAISVDAVITNGDTLGFTPEQRNAWAEKDFEEGTRPYRDDEEAWRQFNVQSAGALGERSKFYVDMWLTPPKEHVFAYWLDWEKTDAGAMLSRLEVPLLSVHAIRPDDPAPAATRAAIVARFAANRASPLVEVAFVEDAYHTIWERQPEAFDRVVDEFVRRP